MRSGLLVSGTSPPPSASSSGKTELCILRSSALRTSAAALPAAAPPAPPTTLTAFSVSGPTTSAAPDTQAVPCICHLSAPQTVGVRVVLLPLAAPLAPRRTAMESFGVSGRQERRGRGQGQAVHAAALTPTGRCTQLRCAWPVAALQLLARCVCRALLQRLVTGTLLLLLVAVPSRPEVQLQGLAAALVRCALLRPLAKLAHSSTPTGSAATGTGRPTLAPTLLAHPAALW
mmetsp:Transcript_4679/g.9004  ORF Transcript_4679/g.9004 Transcript_4679/m.9004 type:complete len:231 (+) Transcript_4679:1090-1782(+)